MDDVNNLAEIAAKRTFIFKKTVTNRFINIFNENTEIASSKKVHEWGDLVPLYVTYITDHKESLKELPSDEEESKKYFNLAFKWAKMSQRGKGRKQKFVNPLNNKIVVFKSLDEFHEYFKSYVSGAITEAMKNVESLPTLPTVQKEWRETLNEIYNEEDKKIIPKHEPTEVKVETPPANYAVSTESMEEMFVDEASKDGQKFTNLRSIFTRTVPMQIKIYDVIKMRDYLRILRRLWNLSQLHDGKEKNIVTFNEERKINNHPYFRTHPNKFKIYDRINDSLIKSFPLR